MNSTFNDAYNFAGIKHQNQTRRDKTPYIMHPIVVASLVGKYFHDNPKLKDYISIAYLHDTIEDTDTTKEEIEEKFGKYVATIVSNLTNDENLKNKMGKADYLCYKMVNMDEDTLNIKLCDRLANINDLKNADQEFQNKYIIETLTIMHYILLNRNITEIQYEIINEINNQINNLRKEKVNFLIKKYK